MNQPPPLPTKPARMPLFLAIPLLVVGLAALAGCGYLTWSTMRSQREHARTEGVVVRIVETKPTGAPQPGRGRGPSGPHYAPEVEYQADGVTHRIRGHVSSSSPSYAKGDKVTVLYPANDPKDGHIDSFSENWLASLVVGGIGAVFTLVGVGGLWSRRQSKASPAS